MESQPFVIDPSKLPKDPIYQRLTYAWLGFVLGLGGLFYYLDSKLGMLVAAVMLVGMLPLVFARRLQMEVIQVESGELVVRRVKPTSEVLRIPVHAHVEVSFEKLGSLRQHTGRSESVWTLNLWDRSGAYPQRAILALRVEKAAKYQIYQSLVKYLRSEGIQVREYDQTKIESRR